MTLTITPYKISTITATGSVSTQVDLDLLFAHIRINNAVRLDDSYVYEIKFIEFGRKNEQTQQKGVNEKKKIRRRKETTKRFDNQATIVVQLTNPDSGAVLSRANMKVFRNGNIQMTGLKSIEAGERAVQAVVTELKDLSKEHPTIVASLDALHEADFNVRLINSDFTVDMDINRERFYKILQQEYNVFASYEPCIYPAVKIQYYWKEGAPLHGCCNCPIPCYTRETSKKSNADVCKKITIAVFQSGCVIVTGARSYAQVDDAYDFIARTLVKEERRIRKLPALMYIPRLHG